MKKYVFLFALALVWGCQDRAMGPNEAGQTDVAEYGSSLIKIPGLAGLPGLAKAAPGTVYKFQLSITGQGMSPMTFSFPIGGNDTAVVIEKIPAGPSRLFTGIIYTQLGPTHEGSAITEIRAGQTSFVKLFMRRTGSAQVDVIIEGVNDDTAGGCYLLSGVVDTFMFAGYYLKIVGNDGSQLWAYVNKEGVEVGKFWGTIDSYKNFSGQIAVPGIPDGMAWFSGVITADFKNFKGELYSMADSQMIGTLSGYSISCDIDTVIIPPPPPDTNPVSECYRLGGKIDTLALYGYTVKMLQRTGSQFWTYIYLGDVLSGKFWGTFDYSQSFTGEIALPGIPLGTATIKGVFDNSFTAFKGQAYSIADTLKLLGNIDGVSIPCDSAITPPSSSCLPDTMGGNTSCKDASTWIGYATEECKRNGLTLGGYSFSQPCGSSAVETYRYICYECCK